MFGLGNFIILLSTSLSSVPSIQPTVEPIHYIFYFGYCVFQFRNFHFLLHSFYFFAETIFHFASSMFIIAHWDIFMTAVLTFLSANSNISVPVPLALPLKLRFFWFLVGLIFCCILAILGTTGPRVFLDLLFQQVSCDTAHPARKEIGNVSFLPNGGESPGFPFDTHRGQGVPPSCQAEVVFWDPQ